MERIRVGQGFDAHPLVEKRRLVLAGVEVPFNKGLLGHSDADVIAHAVADALLGAMAKGDLGEHFPPDDPAYKDADSMEILKRVAHMAAEAGFKIMQVDAVVMAEQPKLKTYIRDMRGNLAAAMGLDIGEVNLKAKTTEGMGFIGRGEGMAAVAVALVKAE